MNLRNTLLIFLFLPLLSCGQEKEELPVSTETSKEDPVDSLKESRVIADWVNKNLDVELTPEAVDAAGIKPAYFSKGFSAEVREELFDGDFLGNKESNIVESKEGCITIDLDFDYSYKKLYITDKYIVVTFHGIMGDYGRSLVYDLQNSKLINIGGYVVTGFISPEVLKVEDDYYGEYHVFETGTYEILTGKYTKIPD